MKGGLDTLVLRLTNRCNLACGYCYAGSGPAGEDLSPERAAEAVALACPPGEALRIQFTGGEPLLRWDTAAKVLDFGRASGRRFHAPIQTNGTLLTPAPCRELRARRVAVGVSLDGVGPDNDARRTPEGEPSFQATARGLQTLAAAGMAANRAGVGWGGSGRGGDRRLDFALWGGNVQGVGLDLVRPQGRGAGAGGRKGGRFGGVGAPGRGGGGEGGGENLMGSCRSALPVRGESRGRGIVRNGGVKLAATPGKALDSLKALENAGTDVLVCGTCLDFYGLLEAKQAGQTTNRLDVGTGVALADKVIRP